MDQLPEMQEVHLTAEVGKVVAEMGRAQDRENKRLWVLLICNILILACLVLTMGYYVSHMQSSMTNALQEALETVAELEIVGDTTTTTQTVEGDSATINNVDGEQFNDSAQKIGGAE